MKPSEILIKAKALIDAPEKWAQRSEAINDLGKNVSANDADACKFCSIGAVVKVNNGSLRGATKALDYLQSNMSYNIAAFNDKYTHAEVMQAWDKAIALAQADEA